MADILREHNYKVTPQRRVVVDVLVHSNEHMTPSTIYEKARQKHPRVGLVTVYRTLDILSGLGLICELHTLDNNHSYLMRETDKPHHHLICSECGKVIDFTDCGLGALEKRLSLETGFEIEEHLLEFHGLCCHCQTITAKREKNEKTAT
ncbi:MAG: transcriptional repressor [Dehalococcoidia bacterium]|nr:transcriptional repressor [Dehalococcoidia bacterium]